MGGLLVFGISSELCIQSVYPKLAMCLFNQSLRGTEYSKFPMDVISFNTMEEPHAIESSGNENLVDDEVLYNPFEASRL